MHLPSGTLVSLSRPGNAGSSRGSGMEQRSPPLPPEAYSQIPGQGITLKQVLRWNRPALPNGRPIEPHPAHHRITEDTPCRGRRRANGIVGDIVYHKKDPPLRTSLTILDFTPLWRLKDRSAQVAQRPQGIEIMSALKTSPTLSPAKSNVDPGIFDLQWPQAVHCGLEQKKRF